MTEVSEYIHTIPEKWQDGYIKLLKTIDENLPKGFELTIQYGMPSYVVPLSKYPAGYLNRETEPLPFISLAAQKNYLSLYHMGLYADKTLLAWFEEAYAKQVPTKLNMGKSCLRMSNVNYIPFELIGELVSKISVDQWIELYEHSGATSGNN
ncbi:DUF1801 domain-containing protein [Vagococcus sp. BWB3-3]|uniref:DUF1801 domain-containing protein n=1 Tax=Vagococcus allomyrinae TaxID=2794353 RepID=A0A940SW68_9ENTE|nr:DUF1801 domain-containing protein [Vagococcus allomyrinae]MBP1041756.1 DUF1801 domain-containing protein [Vagococcus allomyrinae]